MAGNVEEVESELRTLFFEISSASLLESFLSPLSAETRRRLSFLIPIYTRAESVRISKNVQILSASAGISSVNMLSRKMGMNASFIGRLMKGQTNGWTFETLLRISAALEVDPRFILFSDVHKILADSELVYKKM